MAELDEQGRNTSCGINKIKIVAVCISVHCDRYPAAVSVRAVRGGEGGVGS